MKKLIEKYRDVIPYLFFGVVTTIINIVVYWFAAHILHMSTVPATVLAWIITVLAAYLTNRKWVFHSDAEGSREILAEICKFFAARLATGIFDWVFMYVTVDRLRWSDVVMKFLANVVVVVLNYIFSKWVIFRKHKRE